MLLSAIILTKKLSSQAALAVALCLPLLGTAQTVTTFSPATGPAGTSITILGSGLMGAKSVLLNGQSLAINTAVSTANTLVVTVPVAASTGKLVITTASNVAIVSTSQFGVTRSSSGTYFPLSAAKFNSSMRVLAASNTAVTGAYGAVYYSTPTAADLTNTGRTDLLIGNGNGNIEYWKQGTLRNTDFAKQGNLTVNGSDIRVANFAKPVVADLDGNGLLDLLVGTGDNRHIARYEQTAVGATTFNSLGNLQLTTGDLVTNANFPRPAITDLDGNGKLDMLVGDYTGVIKRYEASTVGGVTFVADAGYVQADGATLQTDPTVAANTDANTTNNTGTSKPLVFDMDGNGLLDLVMGSQAGALVRYEQSARYSKTFVKKSDLTIDGQKSINMGAGTNNATTTYYGEGGFAAPLITDIDGDGQLDILMGNANGYIYRFEQAQQAPLVTSPLPVVLSAFAGQATSAGSLLNWATATELNSARFDIERSADGQVFAQVSSVAAAGTSGTARRYQYLDATAPAGPSYYRLHQVDQDGTSAYSPVVVVSRASSPAAIKPLAFPSPFTNALQVALPGADGPQAATVALLTLDGRTVYSRAVQLGTTPQAMADLPTLAPGLYVLRTITAAGASSQRISHN